MRVDALLSCLWSEMIHHFGFLVQYTDTSWRARLRARLVQPLARAMMPKKQWAIGCENVASYYAMAYIVNSRSFGRGPWLGVVQATIGVQAASTQLAGQRNLRGNRADGDSETSKPLR